MYDGNRLAHLLDYPVYHTHSFLCVHNLCRYGEVVVTISWVTFHEMSCGITSGCRNSCIPCTYNVGRNVRNWAFFPSNHPPWVMLVPHSTLSVIVIIVLQCLVFRGTFTTTMDKPSIPTTTGGMTVSSWYITHQSKSSPACLCIPIQDSLILPIIEL